ncbi:1-acyl-sn-glycerol-3-phosphate acyltransferase, putative [Theileria equi strain WA]|uniref:1-acyl-sn-glycerol-3-phosphate acyltransferase, putative n=1 Tax=Theileria equi strain WA TaxID=1537102 RepID=L0AXK3_THEEQ|nr:1-acyl-sn-glycerol-3-phosphate acyltransferase, putative [Theileria equi strain WA]AFZ79639.1 1-acyl-sn-glycerol-3-phosphate acyltransferase, putative [Theileria equi strain WA]|eukprot:XP_004829305.1 1-acyl-sn-glycerol-3-phosphate acyltransferase, putative [Theileria equi strain WA]
MNIFELIFFRLEVLFYFTIFLFLAFSTVVVQFFTFLILFPVLFYDRKFIHKVGNRFIYSSIHFFMFTFNRKWKYVVLSDFPKYDPKRPKIFMFNHLSNADPIFLTVLGKRVFSGALYKDSLHILYPRFFTSLVGHTPIYFTYDKVRKTKTVKKECIAEVMRRCKELTTDGFSILVFPEGTRSKTGALQEFKDGFFRFAMENNYEIVPCTLHNTRNVLTQNNYMTKGTVYLKYGEPILPQGKDLEDLKFEVRKTMYEMIKSSPDFDPKVETVPELE